MPRKPRIMSSTGIYHIILRSVNQHIIFEEDSDYQKFLYILSDSKKKYDIKIYAYCLMDNHIHILLNSPAEKLSGFFQSLGSGFVRWYNNPIKANVCRFASEYRWSSFNDYYGRKDTLIDLSFASKIAGTRDSLLRIFAREAERAEDELFANDHRQSTHYFTDEKALDVFKSTTGLSSTSEVANINKVRRNEFVRALRREGLTVRQVARLMDISEATIKRLCKMNH